VSPAFRKFCLPYIPATRTQISNILQALEGRRGTLLDLGSGDGRIVLGLDTNTLIPILIINRLIVEAAKRNLVAHGVELNIWLVLYSKLDALRKGLANKTSFYRRDLWKFHVGKYDNIVIFGVEQMVGS
jgi:methylase of polypeptide subunit release factors